MVSKFIDSLIESAAKPAAKPIVKPATKSAVEPVAKSATKSAGLFDNLEILSEPPGRELLKQLTEDEVTHLDMFGVNSDRLLRSMIGMQREMREREGKYPCSACLGIAAKLGLLR